VGGTEFANPCVFIWNHLEDAINKQRVVEVAERQDRQLGTEQHIDFQAANTNEELIVK